MINRDRIVDEFMQLVRIDSISKNERKMADVLKDKLSKIGLDSIEDNAAEKIGGNTGNIICNIKGQKNVPPIVLMAHMDTVVPGMNKIPLIEDGYIKSDGSTVLGGDDLSGVVSILEAIRVLKEDNILHGDIQIVFTVAEEVGLLGSKNLDYSLINAKYGIVLDGGGPIGTVAVKAPAQYKINVTIKGKAAHAGVEPENGISAIQIAAEAISKMKLGRIDAETTANVGIINGGRATNIICDTVEIKAEARSRNADKLEVQVNHMKECFIEAAEKFGGVAEVEASTEYLSYDIPKQSDLIKIFQIAAKSAGIDLILEETGGGSDTNIINGKGIQAVDISVGMSGVHTVDEKILIDDMVKAVKFLVEIIKSVE